MRISEEYIAKKFLNLQKKCREFNIKTDLTISDLKKIMSRKTCPYTGTKLTTQVIATGATPPDSHLTLDRIDPDKGYTKGNVIACSRLANMRKGNLSINEVENILKIMRKKK